MTIKAEKNGEENEHNSSVH